MFAVALHFLTCFNCSIMNMSVVVVYFARYRAVKAITIVLHTMHDMSRPGTHGKMHERKTFEHG